MAESNEKKYIPPADFGRQTQIEHIEYSRDVVHRYSPSIRKLFNLGLTYVEDVEKQVRDEGKRALWCGPPWAMPLVYAADYLPLEYGELARLSDIDAISIAENHFQMPAEVCSMVKATVGELYKRRNSGIDKIFSMGNTCEPFNQAWEVLKDEGYDIYNAEIVFRAHGIDGERYEKILRFFLKEIESFYFWMTGTREVNKEKIFIELQRRNRIMTKIKTIMELRVSHPFYVRSLAVMYLLNGLNNYLGKPAEFEDVLDGLIDELSALGDSSEDRDRVIPLVWSGGSGQEFGVYEAVDEANGALLGFVAIAPYDKLFNLEIDPVESLARWQLDSRGAGASVYMRRALEEKIDEIDAKGLIQYGFLGCSQHGVAREMFRDYFHQKGIPSINIEGTFQVGPPSGQVLTRINAFIEMLA
jgi:benzoyl-CoA reductase/2-hydroxyglutaryl-CoA dehydratase subunit BcrC/BadD/HgdB